MKNLWNSLKGKITISVSLFSVVVLIIICTIITSKLRRSALQHAEKLALSECREYAGQITSELDKALLASRTLSQAFRTSKLNENIALSRPQIMEMTKEVLVNTPIFLGTYTTWEPDAFDGRDREFKNSPGHDSTGRFLPYFYRSGNEIKLEPVTGIESEETAAWYYAPKKTMKEHITDPFSYQGVYMISFLSPIIIENRFYGLAGVDFSMDFIQKLADHYTMYEGKSKLTILSESGTIVAMNRNPSAAGKFVSTSFDAEKLKASTEENYISGDTIRTLVSFDLGMSGKRWFVLIETPVHLLLKDANIFIMWIVLICFISLLILITGTYFIIGKLTAPLDAIAENAKSIAEGKSPETWVTDSTSEISGLAESLKRVSKSQEGITGVCSAIAKGDFSQKAAVRGSSDLLAISVNKMIDNLIVASKEDKQRNWTAEGMARFAEILRSETDFNKLYDKVIANLVKYLNASQGGIFIVNDEDRKHVFLELISCYAYSRKKFLQKRVEIGEGLVGQAYLEKDIIMLTEVPDDYLEITSGLGQANPTCIIILPLIYNEDVMGVIELSSFDVPEKYQIDFIKKLAESIASTISVTKINERTRKLLETSQQQTEIMRAQEEEMRQNMEELMATQEEIARKEAEYISEIKLLRERLAN